ncbi:MAG: hypothetical protein AAGJ40_12385 [Planctomycetota bacterium]
MKLRWKTRLRAHIDLPKAKRILANQSVETDGMTGRPIVLDLRSDNLLIDCGRHLASLAIYAKQIDSPFVIRCPKPILAAIAHKPHSASILSMPHSEWVDSSKPHRDIRDSLILRDYESVVSGHGDSWTLRITRNPNPNSIVFPYPMHPKIYEFAQKQMLAELSQSRPREGVFFGGNMDRRYGRRKICDEFGVTNRLDLLDHVRSIVGHSVATFSRPSSKDSFIIQDSELNPIPRDLWLPTLARHRFFLCCPGVAQPVCHHLTEAMSVGTIPLLEYGNRLTPPLEDGVNAVCFDGPEGLKQAIVRIRNFTPQHVDWLSTNATRYFEKWLRGEQVLRRVRDEDDHRANRSVCLPFHSHDLETPRLRAA